MAAGPDVSRASSLRRRREIADAPFPEAKPVVRADGEQGGYVAKVFPGGEAYKAMVAEPVMEAYDCLPVEYRLCVHDLGYVNVYRAWKRGWTVHKIRMNAIRNGGRLVL